MADCYSQIVQLNLGLQEVTQQIRNLTATVAANKTATRDALLQHRFDLHSVTRCIRDVSDMVRLNFHIFSDYLLLALYWKLNDYRTLLIFYTRSQTP